MLIHPQFDPIAVSLGPLAVRWYGLMYLLGFVLFMLLGQVSALFLLGYGVARFVAEFAREPDNFLGLLALNLSMGQWLSLPMMLAGAWLWQRAARQG